MRRMLSPIVVAVLLVTCASQPVNRFASDGVLSREAIELHADGTFVYCGWSDDGPTVFSARGTWRWLDRSRSQLETITADRQVERGNLSPADDLPERVTWTAEQDTLQRVNRAVMRRMSDPALSYTGCTTLAR